MKTTIKQRLKNLWKLSECDVKDTNTFTVQDNEVIGHKDISYRYSGKPQAQIIKRKSLEDEVKQILNED